MATTLFTVGMGRVCGSGTIGYCTEHISETVVMMLVDKFDPGLSSVSSNKYVVSVQCSECMWPSQRNIF